MGEGPPAGEADAPDEPAVVEDAEPDASGPSPLLAWAFAAFHAALLVALVVALLFFAGVAGNQLAALDTSLGVVAYGYLWAVTWWTNRRMVDAVGRDLLAGSADSSAVFVEAAKWGGVAGLLVFLPALILGLVFFVGAGGIEAVPFLLVAGAVGTVLAGGAGVVVGGVFALLDLALLRLARAWLGPGDGSGPTPTES